MVRRSPVEAHPAYHVGLGSRGPVAVIARPGPRRPGGLIAWFFRPLRSSFEIADVDPRAPLRLCTAGLVYGGLKMQTLGRILLRICAPFPGSAANPQLRGTGRTPLSFAWYLRQNAFCANVRLCCVNGAAVRLLRRGRGAPGLRFDQPYRSPFVYRNRSRLCDLTARVSSAVTQTSLRSCVRPDRQWLQAAKPSPIRFSHRAPQHS